MDEASRGRARSWGEEAVGPRDAGGLEVSGMHPDRPYAVLPDAAVTEALRIYVPCEEGGGLFHAPVPASTCPTSPTGFWATKILRAG